MHRNSVVEYKKSSFKSILSSYTVGKTGQSERILTFFGINLHNDNFVFTDLDLLWYKNPTQTAVVLVVYVGHVKYRSDKSVNILAFHISTCLGYNLTTSFNLISVSTNTFKAKKLEIITAMTVCVTKTNQIWIQKKINYLVIFS